MNLCRSLFLLSFSFLILHAPALAQFRSTQLQWFNTSLNAEKTVDGYYRSLPATYSTNSNRYPLIIYLHGDESVEKGYTEILENGIPKLIREGRFPETFKVEGSTHSFIVIAPHYTTKSLSTEALAEAIKTIIQKFRVDPGRIYLTGMSRGGGYTWKYAGASLEQAKSLAAIVPVAGAAMPDRSTATNIGDANLPVWATHNDDDPIVPASNTITFVDWVNDRKPTPRAEITIFKSEEHEGWTKTYDPASKFKGKNIYEWMLQYTRSTGFEEAPLPVTLATYRAYESGTAAVTIDWSVAAENASGTFMLERSADGTNFTPLAVIAVTQSSTYSYTDQTPLTGVSYYRLSQTDANGDTSFFPVLKVTRSTTVQPGLTLYPNPVTTQAMVQLTHSENGPLVISIITTNGMLVQQLRVEKQNTSWQQTINLATLASGNYMLQVQGKTFRQTLPFIKR